MDTVLCWQIAGAAVVGVFLPLFGGTNAVLIRLAKIVFRNGWRPFAPNWITIWGLAYTLLGIVLYFDGHVVLAILIIGFGGILDRKDGQSAKALANPLVGTHLFWVQLNHPGETELGKVLDPAADKLRMIPLYVGFWRLEFLNGLLLGSMMIPETLGTLSRWPFTLLSPFHRLAGFLCGPGATGVGKWKAVAQWELIILCVPFHQGWFTQGRGLLTPLLFLCQIIAWLSLASRVKRVRQQKEIGAVLDEADQALAHQADE